MYPAVLLEVVAHTVTHTHTLMDISALVKIECLFALLDDDVRLNLWLKQERKSLKIANTYLSVKRNQLHEIAIVTSQSQTAT